MKEKIFKGENPNSMRDNDENKDKEKTSTARKLLKHFRKFDDSFEDEIHVEQTEEYEFKWKKLWTFTGPAFTMTIAYMAPGNIVSDIQTGTIVGYRLLWLLLLTTILAIIVQRLAARLGIVTGYHLAEVCQNEYPTPARYMLWILIETAIIAVNIQEVIGMAIAMHILTNRTLPIPVEIALGIVDTLIFLLLSNSGLRKLELFFGVLITVMIETYGYNYVRINPDMVKMTEGLVFPWCDNCKNSALERAVKMIGATILPHNLYFHSAIVTSRKIDRSKSEQIKDANHYEFIQSVIFFIVVFIINVGLTSVFAAELHGKTNWNIHNLCAESNYSRVDRNVFPKNNNTVEIDLYSAAIFLACRFPAKIPWPMYAWAIGLFASGLSSTMTSTFTGQFVMFGFLQLKWLKWKRILFTRSVAIVPTLVIAFYTNIQHLSKLNDFVNAIMSLILPFALIPLLTVTSSSEIMGTFKNNRATILTVCCILFFNIFTNFYFASLLVEKLKNWSILVAFILFGIFYILLLLYLVLCSTVILGVNVISNLPLVSKYAVEDYDSCRNDLDSNNDDGNENANTFDCKEDFYNYGEVLVLNVF
ncbi:Protein Malvolio-like protein [Dinothrombium tinctorium]|uniref:Protein Malvolio-like protein n=1 Tax=Dinothrombium tinctorium TaxID=1965070 RepID=A0A3S3SBW0_9ACAR|nr:Protein Malvolio-like protein [Dinothrombium tinctorium]RWS14875.1 Protein Malvolio-like protein [Dinothrombium tinctorium]